MDWVNTLKKISNKFKFQLFGRNFDDLELIYANAVKFDPNSTGLLSEYQFNKFLNASGVFLTTQQIRSIFDKYAENKQINYVQFIQFVRKDISEKRLATIQFAFKQLSQNGVIPLDKVFNVFNAQKHPHVRARVKKINQIIQQFQTAIVRRSTDKKNLTEQQFFEYWLDVNATIPHQRQEYFIDIIINGLSLNKKFVTEQRIQQLELNLYQRIRQKTYVKNDEGNTSKRAFRYFDLENKGIIDYKRFADGLEKLGCKYLENQTEAIFRKHSKNGELLTYEEFCGIFLRMGSGIVYNVNPVYELAQQSGGYITSNGMTKTIK